MGEYKYVAFISYKSSDAEWANWFHHQLEHYHLPVDIESCTDEDIKKLRPIFLDEAELSGGNLESAIQKALNESKYLIVLCSPDSAKSEWVNYEVQAFIDHGRIEYVIPVIIDGIPYSGDPDTECFVPALCALKGTESERLAISALAGKEMSSVKVVSQILGVTFDSLWNRYEREKEQERQRLIAEKRRLQRLETRYLSERGQDVIEEGNSCLARKLALNILPQDIYTQEDRPFVGDALDMLLEAWKTNDAIINNQSIRSITFSPGEHILTTCSFRQAGIQLWDVSSGLMINNIPFASYISYVKYTPDGKKIAGVTFDGVYIYDFESKNLSKLELDGIDNYYECCDFSPCGKYLAAIALDEQGEYLIVVFDVEQSVVIKRFTGHTDQIRCLTFAPGGKGLYSCSWDGTIRIWNLETDECVKILELKSGVNYITLNKDGSMLLAAFRNGKVVIWDADNGGKPRVMDVHRGQVFVAEFSPDEKTMLTASNDKTAKVWNLETGECLRTILHDNIIKSALFSPDGRYAITNDSTMKITDLCGNDYLHVSSCFVENCSDYPVFLFSHDSKYIYYSPSVRRTDDIEFYRWNLETGVHRKYAIPSKRPEASIEDKRLGIHTGRVQSMYLLADDRRMLINVEDAGIFLFDVEDDHLINLIPLTHVDYNCFCGEINDEEILIVQRYGQILSLNICTCELTTLLGEHSNRDVITVRDRKVYFTYRDNKNCNIVDAFDLESKDLYTIVQLPKSNERFRVSEISHDGNLILTNSSNKGIELWDLNSGQCLTTVLEHKKYIGFAKFSLDDKSVVFSVARKIYLWDVATRQIYQTISFHNDVHLKLHFSPDGTKCASADKTIFVWDLINPQELIDNTRRIYGDNNLSEIERKVFYMDE